jgi:hypothetical protein
MPSTSMRTGALPLHSLAIPCNACTASNPPDLQGPCSQHTRPLVLCHVRSCCALVVVHPLVFLVLDRVLHFVFCCSCRARVAGHHNVVVVCVLVVWVFCAAGLIVVVLKDIWFYLLIEVDGSITVDVSLLFACADSHHDAPELRVKGESKEIRAHTRIQHHHRHSRRRRHSQT